jgi:hypothetical protein
MLAFLSGDMERLQRGLVERFMKASTLKEAKTLISLTKVDVKDKKLHCDHKNIDLGFAATKSVKEMIATKKVGNRQLMQFRVE